jgi:hypothetical protein
LEALKCPITGELFREPVVVGDGFTYERRAIEEAFKRGMHKSPMTNQALNEAEREPIPHEMLYVIMPVLLKIKSREARPDTPDQSKNSAPACSLFSRLFQHKWGFLSPQPEVIPDQDESRWKRKAHQAFLCFVDQLYRQHYNFKPDSPVISKGTRRVYDNEEDILKSDEGKLFKSDFTSEHKTEFFFPEHTMKSLQNLLLETPIIRPDMPLLCRCVNLLSTSSVRVATYDLAKGWTKIQAYVTDTDGSERRDALPIDPTEHSGPFQVQLHWEEEVFPSSRERVFSNVKCKLHIHITYPHDAMSYSGHFGIFAKEDNHNSPNSRDFAHTVYLKPLI